MKVSWLVVCMLFLAVGKQIWAETPSALANSALERVPGIEIKGVPLDLIEPVDGESVSGPLRIKFASLGPNAIVDSQSLDIVPLYGQEPSEIPYDILYLKRNETKAAINLPPGDYALTSRFGTAKSDRTVKISVAPKKGNSLTAFRLLGMVNFWKPSETLSDNCPMVEVFYASERTAAKIFEQNLRKLLQEQSISTPLKMAVWEGGQIEFENCEAARLLNSYFLNAAKSGGNAYLSVAAILRASRSERLAFLLGAYLRYGDGLQFSFASQKSSELVVAVLKSVGVRDVIVNQDPECSVCGSGGNWYVSFSLNDNLARMKVEADDLKNAAERALESTPGWGKTKNEIAH